MNSLTKVLPGRSALKDIRNAQSVQGKQDLKERLKRNSTEQKDIEDPAAKRLTRHANGDFEVNQNSTKNTSKNASSALGWSVYPDRTFTGLTTVAEVPVSQYNGLIVEDIPMVLYGMEGEGGILPHLNRDNNLFHVLSALITLIPGSPNCSPDMIKGLMKSSFQTVSLDTEKLSRLLLSEIKVFGVSQRLMSRKFGISASSFSYFFGTKVKPFLSSHLAQKKAYYQAFLWLNLSLRDRMSIFYPMVSHEAHIIYETATCPTIPLLLSSIRKELKSEGISIKVFSCSFLMESQDIVENLIQTEMVWSLMPEWMKCLYCDMWCWMRQSKTNRLALISSKPEIIAQPILRSPSLKAADLASTIQIKMEKNAITKEDVSYSLDLSSNELENIFSLEKDWFDLSSDQQILLIKLLRWVTVLSDGNKSKEQVRERKKEKVNREPKHYPYLDTRDLSKRMIKEQQEGLVSLDSFAKALNVNLSYVTTVLKLPVQWPNATPFQRGIYKAVNDWLLWNEEERKSFLENNSKIQHDNYERVKFSTEDHKILKRAFDKNPRPSTLEKRAIATQLGVPLRNISIYFSNQRRNSLKKMRQSAEGSNVP